MKIIVVIFLVVFSHIHLNATTLDTINVDQKEKYHFIFYPPFFKWNIPVGDYTDVAKPVPIGYLFGFKYLSDWNIGIGLNFGMSIGTVNPEKTIDHFKEQWFVELYDKMDDSNKTVSDLGNNYFLDLYLFYSYMVSKKLEISLNIGSVLMEIDEALYPAPYTIFRANYPTIGEENRYTQLRYSFSTVPIFSSKAGILVQYKLWRALSINIGIEYLRYKPEVIVSIESDASQEPYSKTFKYHQEMSTISFGIGGVLRIGK